MSQRMPLFAECQSRNEDMEPQKLVVRPKHITMPNHGLVVFESRHGPGFFGELKDPYSKFHLVIRGRAQWDLAGRSYATMPDVLFHIAAGVPHRIRDVPHDPVSNYVIHYEPQLLDKELMAWFDRSPGIVLLNLEGPDMQQGASIRSLFREMLFESEAQQLGWKAHLKARLIELAVRTMRMTERRSQHTMIFKTGSDSMQRVTHYALHLKSCFFRRQTLAAAARSVHLSRRQFTDLFRRVTGESWCRYVRSLRLEHAAKLLVNTNKSVIAVAFEAGFEDLSQFHHNFKEAYHCTPSNYREMHQDSICLSRDNCRMGTRYPDYKPCQNLFA